MRANPVLVYLQPQDRLKLEVVALLRGTSLSLALTQLCREAFEAAAGRNANPQTTLTKYQGVLGNQVIQTQRARRKRRSPSAPTSGGMNATAT